MVWLIVQLVFWFAVLVLTVGLAGIVILAPPFFAARFLYRRLAPRA
jgi:hypothetical protein